MNERINKLLQNGWVVSSTAFGLGIGVGAIAGYMATRKQYNRIEKRLEEIESNTVEIDAMRAELDRDFNKAIAEASYVTQAMREQGENLLETLRRIDKEQAVMKASTASRSPASYTDLQQTSGDEVQQPEQPINIGDVIRNEDGTPWKARENREREGVVVNIFDNGNGDEWDYKKEIENRDRSHPYTIHVDEFVADEMGWDSQSTLTWYEGDSILCDSQDRPIYNHHEVVGELKFGHGSNDPNVVYIRNERLQAEYEVLRDTGSYEEVVLGEAMERQVQKEDLKHSMTRKFRPE